MKAENKIFAAAAALLTLFGSAAVPCLFAAAETAVNLGTFCGNRTYFRR